MERMSNHFIYAARTLLAIHAPQQFLFSVVINTIRVCVYIL